MTTPKTTTNSAQDAGQINIHETVQEEAARTNRPVGEIQFERSQGRPWKTPEPTHYVTKWASKYFDADLCREKGINYTGAVQYFNAAGDSILLSEDDDVEAVEALGLKFGSDVLSDAEFKALLGYLVAEGELEPASGVDVLKMGTTTQAAQFGEANYPEMVVEDMPSPLETAARELVAGWDAGTEIVALGALVERLRAALGKEGV